MAEELSTSLVLYGNGDLRMLPGSTAKRTEDGQWQGVAAFEVPRGSEHLFPEAGSRHPYLAFLICHEHETTFGAAFSVRQCAYLGGDSSGAPSDDDASYTLTMGTEAAPIETHPNFVSEIGGTPSNPLNGAMFYDDEEGLWFGPGDLSTEAGAALADSRCTFAHFTIKAPGSFDQAKKRWSTTSGQNEYAGVDSYLVPTATWRKQYTTRTRPTAALSGVGQIDEPAGPVPSVSGDFNWLYVGMSYAMRGGVYEVTQEWKLSGRNGWIRGIYA